MKGHVDIHIGIDVDVDEYSDMAVAINSSFLKGSIRAPSNGVGVDLRQV